MRWDIFCKVIDNHGDIGVCWRLAAQLAGRGEAVRLWVDDASALAWMAPQGAAGVQVLPWHDNAVFPDPSDVVIEAFGCNLPDAFVARMAARSPAPRWINLEYLTAESFAERAHGLPSPVMAGAGKGLVKHFFYPGFTAATGGLLRGPDPLPDGNVEAGGALRVSLFCYEPAALDALLAQLAEGPRAVDLQVTAGRATAAVQAAVQRGKGPPGAPAVRGALSISYLPHLTQPQFDDLLGACGLNFVRGEDSLARAIWAGRPFVWQIYPQDDDAHHAKLRAFLDWLRAPPSLRAFHEAWNGIATTLPPLDLPAWGACVQAARARLLAQDDLVTQLLRFVTSR
ncbi:MAG: elongation factor P maturation arginine rhamnosyltransferase EarP [Burkholderiales bacterium]|nr:elongation factor P maturation arginine rhamnosyltransferase EarP [Burkholderiales bacterium]